MVNLLYHNMFRFNDRMDQNEIMIKELRFSDKKSGLPSATNRGKRCTEMIHVPAYTRNGHRVSAYERVCGRIHSKDEHRMTMDGTYLLSQENQEDNAQQDTQGQTDENQQSNQESSSDQSGQENNPNGDVIKLEESVSPRYANPEDTLQIKEALGILGYYMPDPALGMTPYPDQALFDAIKAFQQDAGLLPTGIVTPNSLFMDNINARLDSIIGGALNTNPTTYPPVVSDSKITDALIKGYKDAQDTKVPDFKNDNELKDYYYNIAKQPSHEGYVPYPYVDTKGNVTYGVGINAGEKKEFASVPMQVKDANGGWRIAEKTEKEAEFDRLIGIYNANPNTRADKYQGNFRIDEQAAKQKAYEKMDTFLNALRSDDKFGDRFDKLHPEGKLAILDKIYNMGSGKPQDDNRDSKVPPSPGKGQKGLTYKFWPKFFDAIEKRDYLEAAKQSNRKDISHERNKWTRDMLEKGGKVFIDGWSFRI